MAKNAISLLENDEKLAQFKHNALEQAKKFDIEKILPLYERFYEKVTAKSWKFPSQVFAEK
jgi:hypothetical protein